MEQWQPHDADAERRNEGGNYDLICRLDNCGLELQPFRQMRINILDHRRRIIDQNAASARPPSVCCCMLSTKSPNSFLSIVILAN
jgi:hypothetical protein